MLLIFANGKSNTKYETPKIIKTLTISLHNRVIIAYAHLNNPVTGGDYINFIGMGSYHGVNTEALTANAKKLEPLSKDKRKPCDITETGIEGIRKENGEEYKDSWMKEILMPVIAGQTHLNFFNHVTKKRTIISNEMERSSWLLLLLINFHHHNGDGFLGEPRKDNSFFRGSLF